MEYIYAAMLLHSAGKEITEENLSKIIQAAGLTVDEAKVKMLVAALSNINIDEVIKSAPAAFAPVAQPAPAPAPETKEEKKEEKKEEEKKEAEEALAGLAGLFG